MSAQGEGICVGIRMRPLNDREKSSGQDKIFQVERNSVAQIHHGQVVDNQVYNYDKVFNESATTSEVYRHIAKDIVTGVLNGINGTIFAYGQTSSGKTHTMLGGGDQAGVLNMAAQDIFLHISENPNRDFILRASFVEIYNENIRDLIATRTTSFDGYVAIREDPRRGVYCESEERMVSTYDEINSLLKEGISKRAVEATAMNDTSSRSHTIFRLVIESRESNRNGYEGDGAVLVATLNLVDLAGSESVRHTGALGQRAREGGKINQSLLSLSRVIHALSTPGAHVGYRDSKLTRLLQPSLSGNAKMSIVCCITPAERYLEETRSTLQFASRAKLVETHATVNEVLDDAAQIRRLQKEVDILKAATSEDAVLKIRQLEQHAKQLEEELHVKNSTIEQMKSHYEGSSESKIDHTTSSDAYHSDSDRRASKRHRLEDTSEQTEAPRSLASIKDTMSKMLLMRAAAAGAVPPIVTAAVAVTTTPAPAVVVPSVPTVEEPKAVVFNPMTLGLRNQLMKELDFKLVARKSKVDAPMEGVEVVTAPVDTTTEMLSQVQTELIEAREMIAALEARQVTLLSTHENELNTLTNEKMALFDSLTEQRTALEESLLKFSKATEEITSLQAALAEATVTQCVDHTVATSTAEADASQLIEKNERIVALEAEVSRLTENIETMAGSAMVKTSNLTEQTERIAALEQEVAQLKESLDASETETVDLLEQLEQVHQGQSETDSTLNAQLQAKESELTSATEMISTLNTEVARLQGEIDTAIAMRAEAEEDKTALTALQATIEAHMTRITELEAKSTSDTETITSLEEGRAADAEALAGMEAKLTEVIDQGLLAEEHLEASRDSVTELQGLLAVSENKIEELHAELVQAQQIRTEIESHLSHAQEEYAKSQQELFTSQDRVSELERELEQTIQSATAATSDQQSTTETIHTLQTELSTAKEQVLQAQADLVTAQTSSNELTEKISRLESELSELTEKFNSVETEKAALVESMDIMKTEAADNTANSKANSDIITELEASLVQSLNDQQAAEEQLDTLQAKFDELQVEKEQVCEELSTVRAELLATQDKLAMVEQDSSSAEELSTLRSELSAAEEKLAMSEEKFASTEEELSTLRSELSAAEEKLAMSEEKFASTEEELSTLRSELSAAEERLAMSEEKFASTEEELSTLLDEHAATIEKLTATEEQLLAATKPPSPTTAAAAGMGRLCEFDMNQESLDASRKDMDRVVGGVRAELGAKEAEVSRLMSALVEAQERAAVAEQRLNTSDSSFDADGEDQLRRRLAQLQTTVDLLNGEKDNFLLKLQAAEKEAKAREAASVVAVEKLERDCATLEAQISKLQADAAQVACLQENANEIKRRLEDVMAQRDQHQARADAAASRVNTLENLIEEMKSTADSTDHSAVVDAALLAEKNQLQEDLAEIAGRLKKSQEATSMLREQWEAAEAERTDLLDQIAALQTEKDVLIADLSAANDEVQMLAEALEEANEIDPVPATTPAVADTTAATGIAMIPMDSNAEQIAALEAELEQLRADKDIIVLESEVQRDEATQRIAELEELLAAAKTQAVETEERVTALIADVERLETTAADATADLEQTSGVCKYQAQQIADLMAELESAQTELQTRVQDIASNTALSSDEISELTAAKSALETKVEALENEFVSLRAQQEDELASLRAQQEDELVSLRAQMEQRVSAAVEELEMATTSSTEEISNLHEQVQLKTEETEKAMSEVSRLQTDLNTVQAEVSALQAHSLTQEDAIAALETQLTEAHQTGAASEGVDVLTVEISTLKSELQSTRDELHSVKEQCAVHEDMITSLQEQLTIKEQRIQHLETCKMTKEQMEKIKQIKEERKKYQEDAKMLKKQLHQLTIKFDELKQNAKQLSESRASGVTGGGPATDYIISDLKVQLVTTAQQLSQAQDEVKLLKSKLKECSVQLKEYETDHNGVVAVLEKYGVDTRGLIPLDHSVEEDSSALHGDIADAVAQLGEKLDLAKAAVSRREVSKSEKLADLEERLAQQTADAEEAKALRITLEKRLEVLKGTAKTARESGAAMTIEIETLNAKIKELKDELGAAQKRVVSSTEVVSSEVQALEEENIELLKENKDLRCQVSRLKAGNTSTVTTVPVSSSLLSPSPRTTAPISATMSGQKRAFGTDISNTAPTSTAKPSQGEISKAGFASAVSAEAVADDTNKAAKTRRTRVKAKALVDDSSAQVQDEAGECKQS